MVATTNSAVSEPALDRRGGRPGSATHSRRLCLAGFFVAAIATSSSVFAAEPTAIRDTEIENDIRTLAAPVLRAAGLDANDVGIYLVNDHRLNSFVAGGQAI